MFYEPKPDKFGEIHKENIKLIFPNLRQLKNNMGYWIKLHKDESESISTMDGTVNKSNNNLKAKKFHGVQYSMAVTSPMLTGHTSTIY